MSKPSNSEKIILPEKYYLDYFRYVVSFIRDMYPTMLGPQEEFFEQFEQLSEQAQCLYLRLNGRKGHYFRPSKLNYDEIPDRSITVDELLDQQFIRLAGEEDLPELITSIFTKPELYQWLQLQGLEGLHVKNSPRATIESLACNHFDVSAVQAYDQVIVQEQVAHMEMIKIMFFGDPYGDLNQFVVRDVGNVRIPHRKQENFKPIFDCRDQMDELWQVLQWYREFKLMQEEEYVAEEVWQWLEDKQSILAQVYDTSRVVADKFLLRVGQQLEREEMLNEATLVYGWSKRPEAFERKLRSLVKLGETDQAYEYASELSSNGVNASLKLLGRDYLRKHGDGRIRRSTTERISQAQLIDVQYSYEERIETLVMNHLSEKGYSGFFSENFIWRSLFGLIFWDQLYAEDAVMNQPLQRLPSDIYSGFYNEHRYELEDHLGQFDTMEALSRWVQDRYAAVEGESNPFVFWHDNMMEYIQGFMTWLNADQVKQVVLEMAKNPKENCTGFPDLFVYNESEYSFYEVKSPNDHLSPQQLFWIDFFEDQDINVDILRTR